MLQADRKRLRLSSWALVALMLVAAGSQAKLQLAERGRTIDLATDTNRFTLSRTEYAKRGTIFSSDMKPLAEDAESYQLNVQFAALPKSSAFFMDLAEATGIPASEFATFASSGVKSKTWLQSMNEGQRQAIQDLRSRWRASGVSVSPDERRTYPLGEAASGMIGVMREYAEGVSRTGLESRQNKLLTGQNGLRVGLTDRSGAFLPMRMDDTAKPKVDGKDVVLTIDSELQQSAFDAVKRACEKHKAENGAAVVIDPTTGDILAMANYPSFDPNALGNATYGYNVSYMAQLEPGSTFKILTLAKALDAGKVSMSDFVDCSGVFHPTPSTTIHCDSHGGARGHGHVDPIKAIAKSCNVSAAKWALKVGRDDMIKYVEDLGILETTKIGLPAEAHGLFRRDEYAKTLQLAHVGFGQSITATPLGLASAFTMLGNEGIRMQPRLIKRIGNQEIPIAKGKRIVGPKAVEEVVEAMEQVIEWDGGTGSKLRIPGYDLGGKTGTAEKVGTKDHGYVSNFIGFIPAQKPKAVVLVMINDPKVGHYGAEVAGPAFKEIAQSVIRRMNIPPDGDFAPRHRR